MKGPAKILPVNIYPGPCTSNCIIWACCNAPSLNNWPLHLCTIEIIEKLGVLFPPLSSLLSA